MVQQLQMHRSPRQCSFQSCLDASIEANNSCIRGMLFLFHENSATLCSRLRIFRQCHVDQKSPFERDEYSDTSLRNMEDLSSSNRDGVSNSATRPAKHKQIKRY